MSLPKAKRVKQIDEAGAETAVPDDQWMADFIRFTDPHLKARALFLEHRNQLWKPS